MRRRLAVAWAFALALAAAPAAAADGPQQPTNPTELARQRFREATEAYTEGRYSAAASLFEAADRLAPHPSVRYNAATAWEQAGELARAATGYEAALASETLDASRREVAEERLAVLRRGLGKILVERPLGAFITVDHVQRAPVPATFYLLPGAYELEVDYQGTTTQRPVDLAAGQRLDVELGLEVPAPVVPGPANGSPLPPAPPPSDAPSAQKIWGWVGLGAGVALGGAAVVFGLRALSARDRYDASGNTNPRLREEASDLRLTTNLLWGGATVAGVAGLVLVLTAPPIEF